jgi:colanic acid biosynthesis glycosyl transferase WcaI
MQSTVPESMPNRSRRGRALVVTQLYRPEPNFITADVAEALAAHARVTVVTAHPNYPAGRFFPGTRWWRPVRTEENGVTVWRLPFFPDHSTSKVRRFLSYLSFTLAAALFAPFVAGRPRVVWVYQTPFTVGLATLWFRLVCRSRVVFTYADLWPESLSATGVAPRGPVLRLLFAYSRWINRVPDLLICSTRSTLRRFLDDGVPAAKLVFVPVWVDGTPRGEIPAAAREGEVPSVVYAGNLGLCQGLETVVEAAAELRRRGRRVRFDFYGDGASADGLRELAARTEADNVAFHGRVDPSVAFSASASAAAQVVCLLPSPFFRMTIPSKLPFSFAAGAPVLCGLQGESAELAEASGGGFVYDAEDASSLADAVERVLALAPAERAATRERLRGFFREHFAPEHLIQRYVDLVWAPVDAACHSAAARVERPQSRAAS